MFRRLSDNLRIAIRMRKSAKCALWAPLVFGLAATAVACTETTGPGGVDDRMVVGSSGGTITTQSGAVRLQIPAGAVSGNVQITVTPATNPAPSERLVAGSAYEFGPDGLRFAVPVALTLSYRDAALPAGASEQRLRIFKQVGSQWQLDSDSAVVDAAANTVTAQITGFSTHAILHDECARVPLTTPVAQTGTIRATGCAGDGRFHDLFEVEVEDPPAAAGRFRVTASGGLRPLIGLSTPGRNPSTLMPLANASDTTVNGSATFVALGAPDTYQLFVSGLQGSTGDYSLTVDEISPVHSLGCSAGMFIASPVTQVGQELDDAVDCRVTIQFPSNPSVHGKETIEEYYYMRVPAGRTVVVTTARTGGEPGFSPFPTFFLGNGQVVQAPDGETSSRTISFTATQERWLTLGVSATLVDDGGTLRYTQGTYSLTVQLQ